MSNVNVHMIYDINMGLRSLLENRYWWQMATEQHRHHQLHAQLLYPGRVLVLHFYPDAKITYTSLHAA